MPSKLVRWIPAAVAPVVVAGAVALPLTAATAAPNLPDRSAAQVLALVAKAKSIEGFSGTVQEHSDLGLPSIPSTGAGSDSDTGSALTALTGDHTARVWVQGDSRSRVATTDSTEEQDAIRNGSTVWTWDSKTQRATKVTVTGGGSAPRTSTETPQQAADELLQQVGPTTTTTVDSAETVAGQATYTLVLTPKSDDTTVGSVRLAVDAKTGLPLRVQAFARGASSPAAEVAFQKISYSVPAASEFDFTPPKGATVREKTIDAGEARQHAAAATADAKKPTVVGTGWSSVVEYSGASSSIASNPTVQRLSTAVDGGRLIRSSLVNVLLTDDGRVLAGAVPASRLTDLAG